MAVSPIRTRALTISGAVTPSDPTYLSPFSAAVVYTPAAQPVPTVFGAVAPLAGRVPHLVWPLVMRDGRLATVDQDTLTDVRQCVHVILRTPLGARPLAPLVGVEDPTFSTGVDASVLAGRIEQLEDRARVRVEAQPARADGSQRVRVHVELAGRGVGDLEAAL